jgi:predicted nuclease of restriction endonuclease-like (RecB) superfamily
MTIGWNGVNKMDNDKSIERFKNYASFLKEVKSRIQKAQIKANFAANRELIILYWNVGRMVCAVQNSAGWGKRVIPKLSQDIKNELPGINGFSVTNIKRMTLFYREYANFNLIGPQAVGQLQTSGLEESKKSPQAVGQIQEAANTNLQHIVTGLPWGHNVLLMEKIKDRQEREWYMSQCLKHGWSRNILDVHIKNHSYERRGKATTNFDRTLPPIHSDMAQQTLKDPYIFDFLTIGNKFRERELESELLKHIQEFLIELGVGFAFVGRQYHIEVGNTDFYIDLLFYHLKLRCYVVIELKKGPFKPEHAGKLNFYLNVTDKELRQKDDQPSIGLIFCQDKNRVVAEYALQNLDKAIGVSEYQLTQTLPEELKSSLPTVDEIERELGRKE